jgi:hypothetical protein
LRSDLTKSSRVFANDKNDEEDFFQNMAPRRAATAYMVAREDKIQQKNKFNDSFKSDNDQFSSN